MYTNKWCTRNIEWLIYNHLHIKWIHTNITIAKLHIVTRSITHTIQYLVYLFEALICWKKIEVFSMLRVLLVSIPTLRKNMCTPHQASNIFKINTRWKNNAFYSCLKKTNSTTLPLPYLLRCSVVLLIFFGPFLHLVNLKKRN